MSRARRWTVGREAARQRAATSAVAMSGFATWTIAAVSAVTGWTVALAAFEWSLGGIIPAAASLVLALAIRPVLVVLYAVPTAVTIAAAEVVRERWDGGRR